MTPTLDALSLETSAAETPADPDQAAPQPHRGAGDGAGGPRRAVTGRGVPQSPAPRFDPLAVELDPEAEDERRGDAVGATTRYYRDHSRSALSHNDSPDVGFSTSLNPYRGCEHGCSYCYARPGHEYLGLSAGLDFETRIFVKEDAPELLRAALGARRWTPQVIALSGVTDPYQPIERKLEITRRCLEVLVRYRNPVGVITKSRLVARDADLLGELARHGAAQVHLSITSLDPELARRLAPRAAQPTARLAAIETLTRAGVPVGVMVAPVIPGLNDHEIPAILRAAHDAGARSAGYVLLRLPHGVKDLFGEWLDTHRPEAKNRILAQIRETRGGRLNDPRFGSRMRGDGPRAAQIAQLFALSARRVGLDHSATALSTAAFLRPGPLPLFPGT
jgi:DNA repair photolyase